MAKQSGHARKKWRVTIKLPQVTHGKTHKPVELDVNEFIYETLGHNAGVATQRAFTLLRSDLRGISYRDCFISVKCLGDYTKATEALELGIPYVPAPLKGIAKYNAAKSAPTDGEPIAKMGGNICPNCRAVIDQYPPGSLGYTKHMVGECCLGQEEE